MNTKQKFKRHEKKFLISKDEMDRFLRDCGEKLEKSPFYKSTVISIYFDTDNNDLIIHSIEKPEFKEKIRVRSYNTPKLEDEVFFEIKTKLTEIDGKIGYKRRFLLKLEDFYRYLDGEFQLTDEQVAKEINYITKHLNLSPKILIASDRKSYQGTENPDVRVTFDENLRYRRNNLRLEKGSRGKKYFENSEKCVILEVKANDSFPLWLVSALSKNKIFPQSFSKYGKIYQKEYYEGEKCSDPSSTRT